MSERPTLGFHELFESYTGNMEVAADIGDFGRVVLELLRCHDRAAGDRRTRNHERVSVLTALKQLLDLNVLLEMRYCVDARHERGFLAGRCGEDRLMFLCPIPQCIN